MTTQFDPLLNTDAELRSKTLLALRKLNIQSVDNPIHVKSYLEASEVVQKKAEERKRDKLKIAMDEFDAVMRIREDGIAAADSEVSRLRRAIADAEAQYQRYMQGLTAELEAAEIERDRLIMEPMPKMPNPL